MKSTAQPAPKSKAVKIIKIVANVLVWLFVAFAVFMTVLAFTATKSADGVPSLGGKCMISIISNSMEPTIDEGSLILSEKLSDAEKRQLKEQDVISFHFNMDGSNVKSINTHRIIGINRNESGEVVSYITQGDNKEANIGNVTEEVYPNDIVAVWHDGDTNIKGVGAIIGFLGKPTGFFLVIVLPLVAFFLYELIKFIMTVIKVKNDGKKQITAADEEMIKQKAIEEYLRQQKEAEAEAEAEAKANAEEPEQKDGE